MNKVTSAKLVLFFCGMGIVACLIVMILLTVYHAHSLVLFFMIVLCIMVVLIGFARQAYTTVQIDILRNKGVEAQDVMLIGSKIEIIEEDEDEH